MYVQTKVKLHMDFSATAILNGICIAFFLTALALIVPISDNLQIQLRDALDIFRHQISNVSVQFTKLEDQLGLNILELQLGL